MKATRGQDLCKQGAGREQLNIGIVESELDEHSSGLIVDPAETMELGEIASDVRQTTSQLVDIPTRAVGVMITGVGARVELIARLILECTTDGVVLAR